MDLCSFTFQYGSINTVQTEINNKIDTTLHSNMVLLILLLSASQSSMVLSLHSNMVLLIQDSG